MDANGEWAWDRQGAGRRPQRLTEVPGGEQLDVKLDR